jgi:hypothetical protein
MTERGQYYTCIPDEPWSPEKGERAIHPDAVDLGNDSDDCCIRYRCPNCNHRFKVELPQ